MFLTVHASAGLYLGSQISNPLLAFLIGYFSHWILDFIPHGDEQVIERSKYSEAQLKWRLFFVAALDTVGIIALFYILTNTSTIILTPGILWGMLGAVAPDYLWGLHKVTHIRILKPLHKIHNFFHRLLLNIISFKYGTAVQLITLITFILLIINK